MQRLASVWACSGAQGASWGRSRRTAVRGVSPACRWDEVTSESARRKCFGEGHYRAEESLGRKLSWNIWSFMVPMASIATVAGGRPSL